MDAKELTKREYEIQLYDFAVADLFAIFKEFMIKEITVRFQKSKEQAMANPDTESYLEQLIAREKYCMEWIKGPLQKLEPEFISTFSIPDNIVLHFDIHHQNYKNNINDLRKEIKELEEEYKEAILYQDILEERYRQVKMLEPLMKSSKEYLKIYLSNATPTRNTTKEVDGVLDKLEELLLNED